MNDIPTPSSEGTRKSSDGETWTKWWRFNRILTHDEVDTFYSYHNIGRSYGRPGQVYSCSPIVRWENGQTVITQDGGWDI